MSMTGGRVGGVLLTLAGAGTLAASAQFDLGTLRSIGPGMFPTSVAMVLMLLGVAIIAVSERGAERQQVSGGGVAGRGRAVMVIVAVLVFAVLIETAGFIMACIALMTISAHTRRDTAIVDSVIVGVVASVVAALIVVGLLGLPVPLLPDWP